MAAPLVIAVVSYNTRDLLDACLRSLCPAVDAGLAEVWVADNESSDGSPEMVERDHAWAHLLRTGGNLGFGRAVNAVAERTRSEWIAAANADIEAEEGALAALIEAGRVDPRTGAVAPRLILPDGVTQPSVHHFPTLGDTIITASQLWRVSRRVRMARLLEWDPGRRARVPWATGAFLVVRRDAFEAAGGFDEHQWLYAEDMDLCWRLRRAGYEVLYTPDARIRHWENASTRPVFGDGFIDQWMGATYAWMVRRQGIVRTWLTLAIRWAEASLRAAALLPLARRRPERWAFRLEHARGEARIARKGLAPRKRLLEVR